MCYVNLSVSITLGFFLEPKEGYTARVFFLEPSFKFVVVGVLVDFPNLLTKPPLLRKSSKEQDFCVDLGIH